MTGYYVSPVDVTGVKPDMNSFLDSAGIDQSTKLRSKFVSKRAEAVLVGVLGNSDEQ